MTIRVYMVEDHALVRTGMRMILAQELDIEVIGETDTGEQAIPEIRRLKPDVVLCDLHLPGISGREVTERVAREGGPRVIVVSVLEDGLMPKRLIESGASGYVGKGGDASELVRAVRDVAVGKRYLASGIAQKLALSGLGIGGGSPLDGLSSREFEIAMLLVRGLRQQAIAERLNLSPKTVNTHKSRLFAKLGVHDMIALNRLMTQHGLIDPAQAV